jgi:hypothetical protein
MSQSIILKVMYVLNKIPYLVDLIKKTFSLDVSFCRQRLKSTKTNNYE